MKEFLYKNIYFDLSPLCVSPAILCEGKRARIKLFVNKDALDLINEIAIRTSYDNEEHLIKMKMNRENFQGNFAVFNAVMEIKLKIMNIRFKIYSKKSIYWFNARGIYSYHPNDYFDFRLTAGERPPAWVNKSVFYQIFPDRFKHSFSESQYRQKGLLEKKFEEFYEERKPYYGHIKPGVKRWNEPPCAKSAGYEFYMGSLGGITRKINYLKKLGINAIYLTPILKSPSNHRYDTEDYFEIDPMLGGNEGFASFMKAMRGAKIRVILDAVYNHSGASCDLFKKAQAGIEPFCDFYNFYGRGRRRYACWLGHGNLPKFNYASKELCDYIFQGPGSASAIWLKAPYKIDGYRLDVAHMIGRNASSDGNLEILLRMKAAFKKINQDAFILAENFFDSFKMIECASVDSIMNYHGFTNPVIAYLSGKDLKQKPCEISADDFRGWIMDCYAKLPQAAADVMYNQLSSHDISRHNSLLELDYNKISAALLFQFTLPGVPSIFYGDEIGLQGTGDPGCRAPMIWNEKLQNKFLFNAYKKLCAMRKKYDALACGGFRFINVESGLICYIRKYKNETIFCVVNFSGKRMSASINVNELFIFNKIKSIKLLFDETVFNESLLAAAAYERNVNGCLRIDSGKSASNADEKKKYAARLSHDRRISIADGCLLINVPDKSSTAVYIKEERYM